jgi:hypothetical protein
MLRFHVLVHGRSGEAAGPLGVTFDAAYEALAVLSRMFIEPDGSFVWTGVTIEGEAWQVDGNLIDRGESLAYVELKGHCPEAQFDMLLKALGWPGESLLFQLVEQGVLLEEESFRLLAAGGAAAKPS